MTESAPATNRLRRYRSPCLLILPSLSLPPLECCLGTSPIQAEKLRPDRKGPGVSNTCDQSGRQHWADPGDVMKALTRLVGPVPSLDHPIELCFLRLSNWVPRAAGQARATSGTRLSLGSATTCSSSVTPLRPTGATMPNSARCARIELITAVCWRMNRWRVR